MCSFCGADRDLTQRLIAGPGVLLICEQCVLAQDLLGVGGERVSGQTRLVDLNNPADRKARCSFCGKKRQRVAGIVEAPDRPPTGNYTRSADIPRICAHCLTLCDEILSEALAANRARQP
jgi:hypothetical protein